MPDYVIVTDSASDMPKELVEELEIGITPLQFSIAGHSYFDNPLQRDLDPLDFYRMMREGNVAKTSQVNIDQFTEFFEPILQSGKDILYIGFSSGLSGTVSSGFTAAQELTAKYPQQKIIVIDTLAASLGMTLLVYHAVQKKREGLSIDVVAEWVRRQMPHTCHWVTVEDLVYLKRGGRISATASIVGSVLNVKPIIHVDNEGRLVVKSKVRGRKQSLETLANKMQEFCIDPTEQTVFICHADALEDAQIIGSLIQSTLRVKEVKYGLMGPVIGAHTGPGALALFFFGRHR